MAERAHPDDPSIQDHWVVVRRLGGLPVLAWKRSPWKQGLLARYRFCSRYVTRRDVLDIPCGMGWGTSLIRRARSVSGVDISEEAVSEASRRYGRMAVFKVGSMDAIPFPDGSFDTVLCLEGIEHVSEDVARTFIAEAWRVLRRDGILVITSPVPDATRPPNPFHIREYGSGELTFMVSACFTLDAVFTRNIAGVNVVYVVGRRCRPSR